MPWVRFDDQFPINRKVASTSDAAFRLHVEAVFWCARNLTDGVIPRDELPFIAPKTMRKPEKFVPELMKRNLWISHVDGWEINDYLDYQPSKAKVEQERKAKAARQARWKSKQTRRGDASPDVSGDAAPPRPAPTPPKGGRGGGRGNPANLRVIHSPNDWCGTCDERTRHIELDDGRPARCPNCHPNRSAS